MDELHSCKMASSGSFYQLPDELLLKIFTYLDIPDLVLNIQHVDIHWNAIVQDCSFWRDFVFTVDKQMADKEIIQLLRNMPALRALVATRGAINEVIRTLCNTNKFITHLELHHNQKFSVLDLERIVKHLPKIQHLAFPLLPKDSGNATKYSAHIQELHELLSLRLLGYGFTARSFFLKEIASACPLLREVDLGGHRFQNQDIILFLKAKRNVITKYITESVSVDEILWCLSNCKQLQTLHFTHYEEILLFGIVPSFDLPNLQDFRISQYDQEDISMIVNNLEKTTLSNLLKLDLSSCSLDPVLIANTLVNCVHLKTLILQSCSLANGDDFRHIGKCMHLEYLDVHNTTITDVAVEIFAEKCRKLKYLDMNDSALIADTGLQCLMKCSELQTLKLNETQITGQNFHLIPLHLTKLCELHVEYCEQLDIQYIQELQEQMIHLQVHTGREIAVPEDSVNLAETNMFTDLC